MAFRQLAAALIMIAAASPALSTTRDPPVANPSPTDAPDTLYCMRIEPTTGMILELVRCWTRDKWAFLGVDLDKDWPANGVAIRHPAERR
jgi:hypothetical protein